MRAILIDPFAKSVTEVDCTGQLKGPNGIYAWVFPDAAANPTPTIELVNLGDQHHAFLDEEGLLRDWSTQAFFAVGKHHPFAGRALILKDAPSGGEGAATLDLRRVRFAIRWVEPKDVVVPAPRLIGHDGKETLLAGVESWTFERQPS